MVEYKEVIEKALKTVEKENIKVDYKKLESMEQKEDKTEFVEAIQEICNNIYEKTGFTDEILDLQVYINQLRAEYDITDPREIIHTDNGRGFVQ